MPARMFVDASCQEGGLDARFGVLVLDEEAKIEVVNQLIERSSKS